jgi:signal transduction histidine kinase
MRPTFALPAAARPPGVPPDEQAGPRPGSTGAPWQAVPPALVTAVILAAVGCFCALVQGPLWIQDPALAIVNLLTSLFFVCTGLLLRRDRGQRSVAWALMLAGVLRSVDFIDAWNAGPWNAYGLIFGGMDRVFGAWALLRYPGRGLRRPHRAYLILLAGWMLAGRTLVAVTSVPQWNDSPATAWWPTIRADLPLTNLLNLIVNVGEGLFGVALAALLIRRLTRTRGLDRIVMTPVMVAGVAAVAAATASAAAQMVSLSANPDSAYLTESVIDLALPLAFLAAVMQRALLLRGITALAARLSAGADIGAVRHALRAALRDPTLDVLELTAPGPSPGDGGEPGAGRPGDGAPGTAVAADGPDTQAPGRLVEFIRTETGTPIAVVIADPALARYRGLFDAAVQTSGLALQNAQLQAQAAQAELHQVRASRARILEAGLAERRRLERDLHDGVQQHLLGLAAQLTAAMTRTADPQATAAFGRATDGLREVLAELRDLAHGIHPAVLSQGGLAAALEDVAERLPLPVRVTASARRCAPAVEATAYFVACEALTNTVKHAGASSASVVIQIAGSWLDMVIADDGAGGATPSGQGLANIQDRVSALDGEVALDSPPGLGTRLLVRIPCG